MNNKPKCPNCGSNNVGKQGGVESGLIINDKTMPYIKQTTYLCNICGKVFMFPKLKNR